MRRRHRTAGLIVAGLLVLAVPPARAVITRLTPLRDVLHESTSIVTARVESMDADKPALVLVVEDNLKGKSPVEKMAVLLKGDAEAKKNKHVPILLKRLAPKLPLVLFILQQDKKYTAFAYTNGSWFQFIGVESDGQVRWSFTHGEPYLRKTFKGGTAELKQIIVDSLAGKAKPPEPDAKEKPGFGPEVEAEKPREKQAKREGGAAGPLFAVIPNVLVGGTLAVLAMLFPAVFGGLILVLRRWMVALSVLSLNSTLYVAQYWCQRWLAGSWWGTPAALWLAMCVVTLLGLGWAWRRQIAFVRAEPSAASPLRGTTAGRGETLTLAVLSALCLITVACTQPHSLAQLELWGKMLLMFGAALGMATLHAFSRRWFLPSNGAGLSGEGVLLGTMLLAGLGFSATFQSESSAGIHDDGDTNRFGQQYHVAWRFRPPVERCWMASSPTVEGDRVYIGVVLASAFKGSGAVYCVDRKTGKEIWMFNDGGDMKDVFSSPCVAGGRVYIGEGFHQHADCKLYCLDAATGKKLWAFATRSHTESTPSVVNGKVYFGAGDDGLYCLDASSGQEKWHLTGLHVDANPLVIDNRLYGGSGAGDTYKETALFCVDADTGAEHWRLPVDLPIWGMPAVQGEYLYAGLGNGNFLESADKPAGAVLCVERATGKRVWRYDVADGVHVRVCGDDTHVWFASRDQHCYCVDRRTGNLCWKRDLGSPILASPYLVPAAGGAGLYVAASDGLVRRLDPETGQVIWTFDVATDSDQRATLFSSPVVQVRAGRRDESRLIFFGCGLSDFTRGILYCLEEKTLE